MGSGPESGWFAVIQRFAVPPCGGSRVVILQFQNLNHSAIHTPPPHQIHHRAPLNTEISTSDFLPTLLAHR